MNRFPLAAWLIITASPLRADPFCDDLWFARNQLFDRAGYCFSSPLGQAVFDNSDCTGKDITLEPGGAEMVAEIRASEARVPCDVDTSRTWLEIENIALRRRLGQVVYRSEFASGCLGWNGGPLTLLAGPGPTSEPIAMVETGDDIVWEYDSLPWPEGWTFISVYRDGVQTGLGWRRDDIDHALCTGLAG